MENNIAKSTTQNIAKSIQIQEGLSLVISNNTTNRTQYITNDVDCKFIQIHFCLQSAIKLFFNQRTYGMDVPASKSMLLYNPTQDLPMDVEIPPQAQLISVLISIDKLHSFFTPEAGIIHFLSDDNKKKKFYTDTEISANESIVLSQMISYKVQESVEKLFLKAKIYELLSFYFQPKDDALNNCPYLEEEENVEKIRLAKQIIVERMAEPPSLQELADEVKLPLKHLKDGFKQIYGETVFGFLWEYKMEYARRMLNTKKYNVSEVSYKVGYSTASHFIAAFKKKFDITPKRYMGKLR